MANLSNINGKFVVEQTTGYVGVGTTDPNYPIEVLNASAEIALNALGGSIYRVQSDSASNFIIRKEGVGDRLVINSAGNASFAGSVTADTHFNSSDIYSVLSTTGAGTVFLRPNGKTNAANQLTLDSSGNVSIAGNVVIDDGVGRITIESVSGENRIQSTTTGFGAYEKLAFTADDYEFKLGNSTFAGTVEASGLLTVKGDGADIRIRQADDALSIDLGSSGSGFGYLDMYNNGGSIVNKLNTVGDSYILGGNFGIGTDSPSTKFVVSDAGGTGLEITPQDANTRISLVAYDRLDFAYRELNFDAYNYNFRTSGNVKAVMLNNGNVGIGTTLPQALLDVTKNSDEVYDFSQDLGQRSGTATIHINNNSTTVGSFGQIMYDSDGSNQGIARIVFIDSGTASVDTAFVNEINNTKKETLRIKANGNVGIGTNNPSGTLHVKGDTNSNGGELYLQVNNNNTTDNIGTISFGNNVDVELSRIQAQTSGANNNSNLRFLTSTGGTLSQQMVIDAGGNVGIGNTGPGAKLDVNQGSEDFVQRNYGSGNQQGIPQKITITKWYPVISLGTKLLIPVISQPNLNATTMVRMWGHSAVFNRASGYTNRSFTLDFTFGNLRLIYSLITLNSSGNISSVTQTSTTASPYPNGEIQVNFTNSYMQSQTGASYGGVYITLEYMTSSLNKSIIPSGIALN